MQKCLLTGDDLTDKNKALEGETLHVVVDKAAGVGVTVRFTKDNVRLENATVSNAGAAQALRAAADKIDPPAAAKKTPAV